ncbi:hypothetical protein EV361DRAFT_929394 [Lentinula raphanica]|nr:hypothetical protein EV361DRAFT_929394 [Lentinula raphanica]
MTTSSWTLYLLLSLRTSLSSFSSSPPKHTLIMLGMMSIMTILSRTCGLNLETCPIANIGVGIDKVIWCALKGSRKERKKQKKQKIIKNCSVLGLT